MHIGDPAGENACCCSISSSLESASMPESCFFPSEMNETSVKLMPYLKSTMYYFCYQSLTYWPIQIGNHSIWKCYSLKL